MGFEAPHRKPGERLLAIRVMAMPSATNPSGDIFGGWLMSQADLAGGVVAYEVARGRVATVAVNSFQFYAPVLVGDLVSCYAEVVGIGRTSIAVSLEIFVERACNPNDLHRVAEARITYVALDANGRSREIRPRSHAADPA
jgi:acyl-CoA thioesterase YciA